MAEPFKRWYDKNPKTSTALNLMLKFPDGILVIICNGIVHLVERDLETEESLKTYRTLGTDKVLSLYKSKQRNRKYDEHPIVHKMVNYLYQLSDEKRQFMANHILLMMKLTQEYLEVCQNAHCPPDEAHVQELANTYVRQGAEEAEAVLKTIATQVLKNKRTESVEEVETDLRLTDQ